MKKSSLLLLGIVAPLLFSCGKIQVIEKKETDYIIVKKDKHTVELSMDNYTKYLTPILSTEEDKTYMYIYPCSNFADYMFKDAVVTFSFSGTNKTIELPYSGFARSEKVSDNAWVVTNVVGTLEYYF